MDLVNDMDMDGFQLFLFFGGNGVDLGIMKELQVENGVNINQLIH